MTTELETNLLSIIAYREMNSGNGARTDNHHDVQTYCWTDEFAAVLGITVDQCKGVLGSLTVKGFVSIYEIEPGENGVDFTEEGYKAWEKPGSSLRHLPVRNGEINMTIKWTKHKTRPMFSGGSKFRLTGNDETGTEYYINQQYSGMWKATKCNKEGYEENRAIVRTQSLAKSHCYQWRKSNEDNS